MYDKNVVELAKYKDPKRKNASRILHAFVHRKNRTLPVQVTPINTPVKLGRKKKVVTRPWPTLMPTDWIKMRCQDDHYGGYFLLGGHKLDRWNDIQRMLATFWERYSSTYGYSPDFPKQTLPIYLHGDEGRGQCKRPLMVISWQSAIAWASPNDVNSKKSFVYIYIYHVLLWYL